MKNLLITTESKTMATVKQQDVTKNASLRMRLFLALSEARLKRTTVKFDTQATVVKTDKPELTDIEQLVEAEDKQIIKWRVDDKFGDNGIISYLTKEELLKKKVEEIENDFYSKLQEIEDFTLISKNFVATENALIKLADIEHQPKRYLEIARMVKLNGVKKKLVVRRIAIGKNFTKEAKIDIIEKTTGLEAKLVGKAIINKTAFELDGHKVYARYTEEQDEQTMKDIKQSKKVQAKKYYEDNYAKHMANSRKFMPIEEINIVKTREAIKREKIYMGMRALKRSVAWINNRPVNCTVVTSFNPFERVLERVTETPIEREEVIYQGKTYKIDYLIMNMITTNGVTQRECKDKLIIISDDTGFQVQCFEDDLDFYEGGTEPVANDSRPYNFSDNPSQIEDIFSEVMFG